MASKFGKLLLFSAAIGAAVAGTYYYMSDRKKPVSCDADDDTDFDDFSEELDADEELHNSSKKRSYVTLDSEKVADSVKKATEDAIDLAKTVAADAKVIAKDVFEDTKKTFSDARDIANIMSGNHDSASFEKDGSVDFDEKPITEDVPADSVEEFFDDDQEDADSDSEGDFIDKD